MDEKDKFVAKLTEEGMVELAAEYPPAEPIPHEGVTGNMVSHSYRAVHTWNIV